MTTGTLTMRFNDKLSSLSLAVHTCDVSCMQAQTPIRERSALYNPDLRNVSSPAGELPM